MRFAACAYGERKYVREHSAKSEENKAACCRCAVCRGDVKIMKIRAGMKYAQRRKDMNGKYDEILDRIECGGVIALLNVLHDTLGDLSLALKDARSLIKPTSLVERLQPVATAERIKVEDDLETMSDELIMEPVSVKSVKIMEKLLTASEKTDILDEILHHLTVIGTFWVSCGWNVPFDLTFVRDREKKL